MKPKSIKQLKHSWIILTEQCKRVKVKPTIKLFKDKEWFTKHTWTEKEQEKFIQWLKAYLYKHAEARREIGCPLRNQARCLHAARMWCLNYGWKLEGA